MNAFVNGELGTVKYVGRVEFAEGIWVGVHLKNQSKYCNVHLDTIHVSTVHVSTVRVSTTRVSTVSSVEYSRTMFVLCTLGLGLF